MGPNWPRPGWRVVVLVLVLVVGCSCAYYMLGIIHRPGVEFFRKPTRTLKKASSPRPISSSATLARTSSSQTVMPAPFGCQHLTTLPTPRDIVSNPNVRVTVRPLTKRPDGRWCPTLTDPPPPSRYRYYPRIVAVAPTPQSLHHIANQTLSHRVRFEYGLGPYKGWCRCRSRCGCGCDHARRRSCRKCTLPAFSVSLWLIHP